MLENPENEIEARAANHLADADRAAQTQAKAIAAKARANNHARRSFDPIDQLAQTIADLTSTSAAIRDRGKRSARDLKRA
jgi:hypothetical protein